jgi:3D (Asp-Asp-Asp) domain-containing protein
MILSRSIRRKILATLLTASGFLLVYEATVVDSRSVAPGDEEAISVEAGTRMQFEATAYCKGHTTASGVAVRAGIAAADPKVLPIGSVIQVDGVDEKYRGVYTVLDTGPEIKGREIDVYIWSCYEALDFGRRPVDITVLRLGWHQGDTALELKDGSRPQPVP